MQNIQERSINAKQHLFQFKTFHRLYKYKTKLHEIFPEVSLECNKYKAAEDTLIHSLWTCSKLQRYWTDILSRVHKREIDPETMIAILGVIGEHSFNRHEHQSISIFMVLANTLILQRWKLDNIRPHGNMITPY